MAALAFDPEFALGFVLGPRLALELGEALQVTGPAEAGAQDAGRPQAAGGAKLGVGVELQALGDEVAVLQQAVPQVTPQRDAARLAKDGAAALAAAAKADAEARGGGLDAAPAATEALGDLVGAETCVRAQDLELGGRPGVGRFVHALSTQDFAARA